MFKGLIVLPEILLSSLGVIAILFSLFAKTSAKNLMIVASILLCIISFFLLRFNFLTERLSHESFSTDPTTLYFKIIILIFLLATLVLYNSMQGLSKQNIEMEVPVLLIFASVGAFISISSNDFVLLFCGLELQALSSYALASCGKSIKSSEAGVKYFVLGALMSCVGILGLSFVYGFSGSLKFQVLFEVLNSKGTPNIGVVIGCVLFLSTMLFKLSAAPLHFWTPDIYEGTPVTILSYFSTAQKIAASAVLINITQKVFGSYSPLSNDPIKWAAILSIIIGSLGALKQNSLKRLMGYCTILNMGYVLIAISLGKPQALKAAMIYIITYSAATLAFFALLISLLGKKAEDATFEDLNGMARSHKTTSLFMCIVIFSMIGIPPFAGFIGKYYVFYEAVTSQDFIQLSFGLLGSVIASFYYLKIIRSLYFIEPKIAALKTSRDLGLSCVTLITIGFLSFFFLIQTL
jgi:NADH-quinone oxidoreductase subunit N